MLTKVHVFFAIIQDFAKVVLQYFENNLQCLKKRCLCPNAHIPESSEWDRFWERVWYINIWQLTIDNWQFNLPLPNPPPKKWGGDYRIAGSGAAYIYLLDTSMHTYKTLCNSVPHSVKLCGLLNTQIQHKPTLPHAILRNSVYSAVKLCDLCG